MNTRKPWLNASSKYSKSDRSSYREIKSIELVIKANIIDYDWSLMQISQNKMIIIVQT
jgi:hypothetical protein